MCPGRIVIYNINELYTKSIKKATKCIKIYMKKGTKHSVKKLLFWAWEGDLNMKKYKS